MAAIKKISRCTNMYQSFFRENPDLMRHVAKMYFGKDDEGLLSGTENAFPVMAEIFTDSWFQMPAIFTAHKLAEKAKSSIFLYKYAYPGSVNFCDLINLDMTKITLKMGARALGSDMFLRNVSCHADQVLMLFKPYDLPLEPHYTESDKKVAGLLLELWTNFVKYSQPSPHWHRYIYLLSIVVHTYYILTFFISDLIQITHIGSNS